MNSDNLSLREFVSKICNFIAVNHVFQYNEADKAQEKESVIISVPTKEEIQKEKEVKMDKMNEMLILSAVNNMPVPESESENENSLPEVNEFFD